MTIHAELFAARRAPASAVEVEIASVATAVPRHVTGQAEVSERAHKIYPQYARLDALYTNTGIERRYSVEPKEWYLKTHTWEERTEVYQRNALDLLEQVAVQAVAEAGLALRDIDTIVTNTITGLAIPTLEARLMNRLAFRPDVQRLPMFGFGCGGGVAGLARATRMAQAQPGSNVLFLTIDLCSLCLRINDPSLTMFVAAALFGDGAAGVVLRSRGGAHQARGQDGPVRARIGAIGEYFWPKTEHIMGFDIKDDGFGIVLSPELPALMRERLAEGLLPFLAREGLSPQDFDGFLLHPGGSKVLTTIEDDGRPAARATALLLEGAERLRQHVIGDRAVRPQGSPRRRRPRTLLAGGIRSRLLRLFHRARSVDGRWGSAPVLVVADLLQPIDGLAALRFLDGDVRHGGGRRGAVPVLFAGREPDDVAGTDLLDRAAIALRPAAPRRDDQGLPQRMGMPGGTRARLERDAGADGAGRIGRLEQRVDAHGPGKPIGRPYG